MAIEAVLINREKRRFLSIWKQLAGFNRKRNRLISGNGSRVERDSRLP
jgi:hypothetical protein